MGARLTRADAAHPLAATLYLCEVAHLEARRRYAQRVGR